MAEEFSQKRPRSVVVTGVGLISPLGVGTEETWQAILNGRNGIAPITLFSADIQAITPPNLSSFINASQPSST